MMEDQNLKNAIDSILKETFKEISNAYKWQKEKRDNSESAAGSSKSLIVFPKYKDTNDTNDTKYKTRVSEQELRFIFVETFNNHFNNNRNKFYSVETPTNKSYVFDKDNGGPKVVSDKGKNEKNKGVSARIDLVIMAKEADGTFKRVALIEFKAHNPDVNDYKKDICKLINEEENNPECLKYFIQIINVKNLKRTLKNITEKIKDTNALKEKGKKLEYCINYRCFNIHPDVEQKEMIKGEITDKGNELIINDNK